MGYYTKFNARVLSPDSLADVRKGFDAHIDLAKKWNQTSEEDLSIFKEEYVEMLKKASKSLDGVNSEVLELFQDVLRGAADEVKWYDHEIDMKALSKQFPDFLFELRGQGEENADIWLKWFFRGKMQGGKAKIVMPVLDLKAF